MDEGCWKEVHRSRSHVFWIKTFSEDEVPINIVFYGPSIIGGNVHRNCTHKKNLDKQTEEGKAFVDHEIFEMYPDDIARESLDSCVLRVHSRFGSFVPLVHSNSK